MEADLSEVDGWNAVPLKCMSNLMDSGLLSLPTELLDFVLDELPLVDVFVCKKVCSRLSQIVNNNVGIQYRIELEAASMVDNGRSSLSTAEKLQRLRELEQGWRRPSFSKPYTMRGLHRSHVLLGYHLVRWTPSLIGDIHFHQVPSRLLSMPERRWVSKGSDAQFPVYFHELDPSQDLLAIMELREQDETPFSGPIHLLALSTREVHPLASRATLEGDSGPTSTAIGCTMRISGDHIIWQETHDNPFGPNSRFRVWNWKTGKLVWNLHTTSQEYAPTSFAVFDDEYIVLSVAEARAISLRMYRIERDAKVLTNCDDFDCSFELPELADDSIIMDLWITTQETVNLDAESSTYVPFSTNPHKALFVLEIALLKYPLTSTSGISRLNLFVPTSVFSERLRDLNSNMRTAGPGAPARRTYSWMEWGRAHTRMLECADGSGLCFGLLGWKAIVSCKPRSPEEKCYEIYDFSPALVQRETHRLLSPPEEAESADTCVLVQEPTTLIVPHFVEAVRTELPYRSTPVHFAKVEGVGATEAGLREDGIVLVDRIANSEDVSYRVFTF